MSKKDAWLRRIELSTDDLLPSEQDALREFLQNSVMVKALNKIVLQAEGMKEQIIGLNLMNSADLGKAMVLQGRIQMIFKFLDDLDDLSFRPDKEKPNAE